MFLFEKRCAEKLHKPKRKETVTEILRNSVRQLERFRHPKILQVLHPVEECSETLAFASEPVLASLANVLAFQESAGSGGAGPPSTGASSQTQPSTTPRPPHAREYHFLDVELKYGILQVSTGVCFCVMLDIRCSFIQLFLTRTGCAAQTRLFVLLTIIYYHANPSINNGDSVSKFGQFSIGMNIIMSRIFKRLEV